MITTELGIPVFFILFFLNLLVASTRVSLLNARSLRLLPHREQQGEHVARVIRLIEQPRLRVIMRLSQSLVRFLLVGIFFLLVSEWVGEASQIWIHVAALTLLVVFLLIIEVIVETAVLQNPEQWALRLWAVGKFLSFITAPLALIPILLLRPQVSSLAAASMTEDELKTWVESDEEAGSLEREERQMIYSIFQFGDTLAREIMVPRIDMLALDVHTPLAEATGAFVDSGYSRVPVYEGTVDNILGLLYAKDLLFMMSGKSETTSIRDNLRPVYFVPETKKADDLLAEMQAQRFHMAVIVDEYGGVAGLVTLEDIVEEIIGEIRDEYDQSEELQYQEVAPGEYVFMGRIDLDDFNEIMDSDLPKIEADTLGGFLYEQIGHVPQGGEKTEVDGLLLTIEQVLGRRIRRVRATRISEGNGETYENVAN